MNVFFSISSVITIVVILFWGWTIITKYYYFGVFRANFDVSNELQKNSLGFILFCDVYVG